ncbi:MAG: dienelactone hydrolase family protein [Hyphomonadaceae bacterium]
MAALTSETIASKHDGFRLSAVRARPTGPRRGGVVVIQEIFGISDHIREITGFFADQGYEALAPSLYDRVEPNFHADMTPEGIAKGRDAAMGAPRPQLIGDMQAAIEAAGEGPIFITGFCFGGAMSWLAAQHCTGLKAASGFYGSMIVRLLDAKPRVPIILHYGKRDAGIPQSDVDQVRAFAPEVPIYLYEAGHGFCRKASADYHEPSRALGLQRTLDFFAQNT